MSRRISLFMIVGLVCSALVVSSCSVYKAANLPPQKNVSLFRTGTPRNLLVAEFGPPITTTTDGKRVDVFRFTQGYAQAAKAGRAFFHGAADVLTIGLWEVVGTPLEATFEGTDMAYQVEYDEHDQVERVVVLKQGR